MMQYFVTSDALVTLKTECLVVAVFNDQILSPSAQLIDEATNGVLSNIAAQGDLPSKPGQSLMLHALAGISAPRVLLIGFGAQDKLTENDFNTATNTMVTALNSSGATTAALTITEVNVVTRSEAWKVKQTAINAETALYKYTVTKSDNKVDESPITSLSFVVNDIDSANEAAQQGAAIGQGMNLARELGNLPGNVCTPTYLAEQAIAIGKQYDSVTTTVLEEADMEALGMGSLLSVSRGSVQPAKLISMEYNGAGNDSKPVVFVGKGLTFDAGGISLKPSQGMDEMKYDMCGSASVFGMIKAIAELKLPINVVGVVPSSENLPDGDANKPGDIVTSMAGKTIEILNTDAEGRLILCDALTYSAKFNPEIVIDIATLTGAIIVALGGNATGLMANDQALADDLIKAGHESFDRVWQLPLWDDYQKQLDSNFADIANIGGKEAGSVTAACFLSRFTEDYTWAHLDIAGTAWVGGKAKGATGRPVPLLVQYLMDRLAAQ
jgi:leucyl aminopeptidase